MPICIAAQMKKGKSKESAGRICGEIEKRTNQKQKTASANEVIGNESYEERIERIINEYNIDRAGAVAVVNDIIEEERAVLEAEEYALLKQLKQARTQ